MFATYSSGYSQDSLHEKLDVCPKFALRRTRLAVLLVGLDAVRGRVARDIRRSTRRVHRARGADHNADPMPDRGSNPGKPAAVVRHQLGQSGSR